MKPAKSPLPFTLIILIAMLALNWQLALASFIVIPMTLLIQSSNQWPVIPLSAR